MERRREKAEQEAARQRRLQAYREEEEEKADAEKSRRDVLDQLATTDGNANKITRQAQRVELKKSSARRANFANSGMGSNGSAKDWGLTIRGLKKKEGPVVEKPYDPFGGVDLTPSRYVLQDEYDSEWLANAKNDTRHMAGGYSLQEYYARTMFEAFSGLGIFIENEVAGRGQPASSSIGTVEADGGKVKLENMMEFDDVFR